MEVLLAKPRGFCAGVERAIEIVDRALAQLGAPIYVRHEIVHNRFVVEDLRARGAVFVKELDEVPRGGTVIFSAHGVPKKIFSDAEAMGLKVFDATCPLVTKVHVEVAKMLREGNEVVMIGHRGHPEAEGTMGQSASGMYLVETLEDVARLAVGDPERLCYVTQTTLSVDDAALIVAALRARFPQITGPKAEDICYATSNRQAAVKAIAGQCDLVLVIGAPNSSNSLRLVEVAQRCGARSELIQRADDIRPEWLTGVTTLGVTAGASAPEELVREVVARIASFRAVTEETVVTAEEQMVFKLPRQLTD